MTQTKAQLEARVAELEWGRDAADRSKGDAQHEAAILQTALTTALAEAARLEGWQSCAREFMDKRGSTNNFQHVTVCTGAKMVVK